VMDQGLHVSVVAGSSCHVMSSTPTREASNCDFTALLPNNTFLALYHYFTG
jgi:hypothetical protein